MSGSYWQSQPYLDVYEWLVKSLHPLQARTKAKACRMISDMEWQTLADMDDRAPRHNETLLKFLERREDAFSCLIAIVSGQGFNKEATHLRKALRPVPLATHQHPASVTSVASTHHSASPEHSEHQLVQEPPTELQQAPSQELPLQLHAQPEAEAHLLRDDPLQPRAKRPLPPVYSLDDLNSGRVQAAAERIHHDALNPSLALEVSRPCSSGSSVDVGVEESRGQAAAERIRHDALNSPLALEVSRPCSSDSSVDTVVDESTINWMHVYVILEKVNPLNINAVLSTLRNKFKVDVEGNYLSEDPKLKAAFAESGNTTLKEYYDTAITTVKIVVGVDKLLTEQESQEVAQLVKSSLLSLGIKLVITCVDNCSIVIYGYLPVTDLIRLYNIAACCPGVLAGLGILEIGTLGRDTHFSFRPSPAGPDRVPLDSATTEFVRDMSPPDQVQEILGQANVHYVIRELISRLQPDGPTLERVLLWLEAHGMSGQGNAAACRGAAPRVCPLFDVQYLDDSRFRRLCEGMEQQVMDTAEKKEAFYRRVFRLIDGNDGTFGGRVLAMRIEQLSRGCPWHGLPTMKSVMEVWRTGERCTSRYLEGLVMEVSGECHQPFLDLMHAISPPPDQTASADSNSASSSVQANYFTEPTTTPQPETSPGLPPPYRPPRHISLASHAIVVQGGYGPGRRYPIMQRPKPNQPPLVISPWNSEVYYRNQKWIIQHADPLHLRTHPETTRLLDNMLKRRLSYMEDPLQHNDSVLEHLAVGRVASYKALIKFLRTQMPRGEFNRVADELETALHPPLDV